jgi:hypothetical protein
MVFMVQVPFVGPGGSGGWGRSEGGDALVDRGDEGRPGLAGRLIVLDGSEEGLVLAVQVRDDQLDAAIEEALGEDRRGFAAAAFWRGRSGLGGGGPRSPATARVTAVAGRSRFLFCFSRGLGVEDADDVVGVLERSELFVGDGDLGVGRELRDLGRLLSEAGSAGANRQWGLLR